MSVEHIVLSLIVILGLSLLAQPVSRWLRLPYTSLLVLLGFISSEVAVYFGVDTGLRADNFQHIVFYVFLPILVFEAAYNIDKQQLMANLTVILSLAIIAMLFSCLITATLLFYGIAHESGFPWLAALLTGAILAATDPVAVVSKLREIKAPKRLTVLLEGESLFNDATAIVLFGLFLSMATAVGMDTVELDFSFDAVSIRFTVIFLGGAITGLLVGLLFGYLQKYCEQALIKGVMSLVVAYGSYLLAEHFMVSGVMSTLLAGLSFSIMSDKNVQIKETKKNEENNKYLWEMLAHVANVSVFLVMGAVVTLEMFEQRWLAILIAIVALLFARTVSVYGVLAFFSFFKNLKVSLASQAVMVWGGLRGAVTLALALSVPTSLEYWWTIQSIAFGVVIFSMFVQAPSMQLLAKKLLAKET